MTLSKTTLAEVTSNVRSQTGTLIDTESGLYEPMLIDIVHRSVLTVYGKEKQFLRSFYSETVPVSIETLGDGKTVVKLTPYTPSDIETIRLVDDSGIIDLVRRNAYNIVKSVYNTSDLASTVFGIIDSITNGSQTEFMIELVIGASARTLSNLRMSYVRVPNKATALSGYVDIPEPYIPIVEATACRYVFEKLGRTMLPDNKIIEDLNAKGARK